MKKITYLFLAVALWSCSADNDLASDSVILGGDTTESQEQRPLNPPNPLDTYIENHFTNPYNIRML